MLFIALFASSFFYKSVRAKGYKQSRVWIYPLIIGAAAIAISSILVFLVGSLFKTKGLMELYPYFVSFLAIILECIMLKKIWKQIKLLPDRNV